MRFEPAPAVGYTYLTDFALRQKRQKPSIRQSEVHGGYTKKNLFMDNGRGHVEAVGMGSSVFISLRAVATTKLRPRMAIRLLSTERIWSLQSIRTDMKSSRGGIQTP
jgi:hypothetical protein